MTTMNVRRLEKSSPEQQETPLVIGDLMLDEFVWGKVAGFLPKRPCGRRGDGRQSLPRRAANVSRNLREFIDEVAVVGLIGSDHDGRQLRGLLADQKIDTTDVIEDAGFGRS